MFWIPQNLSQQINSHLKCSKASTVKVKVVVINFWLFCWNRSFVKSDIGNSGVPCVLDSTTSIVAIDIAKFGKWSFFKTRSKILNSKTKNSTYVDCLSQITLNMLLNLSNIAKKCLWFQFVFMIFFSSPHVLTLVFSTK